MEDIIRWRAIYKDGTILPQYCKCGFPRGYENIEREKLAAFEIFDKTKPNTFIFRLFLEEGQKLIYRRRVEKDLMSNQIKRVLYLVGWQQKVNGKNIQSVNYITEDGKIQQAGRWVGKPPILRPEEKDG